MYIQDGVRYGRCMTCPSGIKPCTTTFYSKPVPDRDETRLFFKTKTKTLHLQTKTTFTQSPVKDI